MNAGLAKLSLWKNPVEVTVGGNFMQIEPLASDVIQ